MLDRSNNVPQTASEVLGNLAGLSRELGSSDGLGRLCLATSAARPARIDDLPALRRFLDDYATNVLVAHELPAVLAAFQHATRFEVRELLDLDRRLRDIPALQPFAEASGQAGRVQLKRLRPLRSERVVHRYLNAITTGEANGWHTMVFGVVLAVYSLPLRQGLTHFAHQTLGGFVYAAGRRLTISDADRSLLLTPYSQAVTDAMESLVSNRTLHFVAAGQRS